MELARKLSELDFIVRRYTPTTGENMAALVAIGCSEGYTESAESWREFFSWLKGRGLSGVRLVTGDKCAGIVGAHNEVFLGARHRRCTVHFTATCSEGFP